MFNAGQPEIQYIGTFHMEVPPCWYAKSEIYPISSIDSKIVNETAVKKLFEDQYRIFQGHSEKTKSYKFGKITDRFETLRYERGLFDGYGAKVGVMVFEITEESKLREKRQFLSPAA